MWGKSQVDREFNFLPTIPDFADISDNIQRSVPETRCLCVIGALDPAIYRTGNERNPSPTSMTVKIWVLLGMIADHCRNLGRVGKIETLPIF